MSSGCKCGSNCSCGDDCKCGKKYPDLGFSKDTSSTMTIVAGFAPVKIYYEGSGSESFEAGTCKCCNSHPCKCGK
ncbi:metallothionein-like protein 1 [Corylus avellana]|uniref:metallothionein-like protein 1 n=1 Tax=Corylus avellana TaxID=13451 RepID=UPI00286AB3F3|nr:metallothionein-like protein 1 [Corylus avellana]